MRRIDRRGQKECVGACAVMACWMDSRFAAVNMETSARLVMIRVFEAGEGCESWGRSERSRLRV